MYVLAASAIAAVGAVDPGIPSVGLAPCLYRGMLRCSADNHASRIAKTGIAVPGLAPSRPPSIARGTTSAETV